MADKTFEDLSDSQRMLYGEAKRALYEGRKEGIQFLREQFQELVPLFEVMQADPSFATELNYVLRGPYREKFLKTVPVELEQDTAVDSIGGATDTVPLVDTLSIFNPYIAGAVLTDRALVREFLRTKFQENSKERRENLDGKYLPVIALGAGVHSTIAAGEILERSPELARNLWVFDLAENPGGPFGKALGKAFRVNSASSGGGRASPGERLNDENQKRGDINKVVDFLTDLPDLTGDRYPDNELLALTIAMQLFMTCKNVVLETRLTSIRKNEKPSDSDGKYFVTLEYTMADGKKTQATVSTDWLIIGAGIGEETFSLDTLDPITVEIIEEQRAKKDKGEPTQLKTTLDVLGEASDPREPFPLAQFINKTIGIGGDKDSGKIVIELLAGIGGLSRGFSVATLGVIEKIKLIGKDVALSCEEYIKNARPRYLAIAELIDRIDGRKGLVSGVRGQVKQLRKAVDGSGKLITVTDKGELVPVDIYIAATGFRNKIGSLFKDFFPKKQKDLYRDGANIERFCRDSSIKFGVGTVFEVRPTGRLPYSKITITDVNRGRDENDRLYTCEVIPSTPNAKPLIADLSATELRNRLLYLPGQISSVLFSTETTFVDNTEYVCLPDSDVTVGNAVVGEDIDVIGPSAQYKQTESKTKILPKGTVGALVAAPENPVAIGITGRESQLCLSLRLEKIMESLLAKIDALPKQSKQRAAEQLSGENLVESSQFTSLVGRKEQRALPLDLKHATRLLEMYIGDNLGKYEFSDTLNGESFELSVALTLDQNGEFSLSVEFLSQLPQSHIEAVQKMIESERVKNLLFVILKPYLNLLRTADYGKQFELRISIPIEKKKVDRSWIGTRIVKKNAQKTATSPAPIPAGVPT